jgi:hypothetical protein
VGGDGAEEKPPLARIIAINGNVEVAAVAGGRA